MRHADLVAHRHQTPRQVVVVLAHQSHRDHDVVDVAEHEGMLGCIPVLLPQEGEGVVAPVTARVQVVRGVVAVIVAEAVALFIVSMWSKLRNNWSIPLHQSR